MVAELGPPGGFSGPVRPDHRSILLELGDNQYGRPMGRSSNFPGVLNVTYVGWCREIETDNFSPGRSGNWERPRADHCDRHQSTNVNYWGNSEVIMIWGGGTL